MVKFAIRDISSKMYLRNEFDRTKQTIDPFRAKLWSKRSTVENAVNNSTFSEYMNKRVRVAGQGYNYPQPGTILPTVYEIVELELSCKIVKTYRKNVDYNINQNGTVEFVVLS